MLAHGWALEHAQYDDHQLGKPFRNTIFSLLPSCFLFRVEMKWKGRTRILNPVPLLALRNPTDGFLASLLMPLPDHPLLRSTAYLHRLASPTLFLLTHWPVPCWKLSIPFALPPLSICVPSPGPVHCVFDVMASLSTDARLLYLIHLE